MLGPVVQIALDPPPGLISGGNDPRTRRGQLGAALRIRDRHRNQLREIAEARLSIHRQGLLATRTGDSNAPYAPLDHDRRPDRRADAPLASANTERTRSLRIVVHPGA